MRVTHQGKSFRKNDPWTTCIRCGFDYRKSEMVKEHTGKEVCKKCCFDPPTALSKARRF